MSDVDSDSSLPLPTSPGEDGTNGRGRKLSVGSDSGMEKIVLPQPSALLDEIPYPAEMEKDDTEIPLPPDSSKYSPSQAMGDDDAEMNASPAQSTEATNSGGGGTPDTSKPRIHVLGKEQAKKRLAAFSAAKLASAAASSKKTSATKGVTVFHQSKSKSNQQENLAIASIKQEEEKMKEVMALNSILSEKLKQVSVISTSIPKPPPVTAVVIPTVLNSTEAVRNNSETVVPDFPTESVESKPAEDGGDSFIKKSQLLSGSRNIRGKRESSSSRSRSRSHSKSDSSIDAKRVRRSRSRDKRSRSREVVKRSKERRSKSRSSERPARTRDKRSRSRDRSKRSRSRDKRSRSRERHRRRSKSRERRSRSKETDKGRGKRDKRRESVDRDKNEKKSSRRSKSRSATPPKKKDKRKSRSRSKSPHSKSKKKEKHRSRNSRSRSNSREREIRERKKERELREKERREKEIAEREKRERERKEAQRRREREEELERELDKVRRSRMPNDWNEFSKYQFKFDHIQSLWRQFTKSENKRARSGSRSSGDDSGTRSRSVSKSKEVIQPTPLTRALQRPVRNHSTIQVELQNGEKGEYPAELAKKTTVQPAITYGINPLSFAGYYKSREQILKVEASEVLKGMNEIIAASGKSSGAESGTVELHKGQQWFASNEMAFCPSDGSKGVLISHLYSDDMEDSTSENGKTSLQPIEAGKKSGNSSSRSDTKSKSSEETDAEQDSMDSAPSPLLKKKYEHDELKPKKKIEETVAGDVREKRIGRSPSVSDNESGDEYKSRSNSRPTVVPIKNGEKEKRSISKREEPDSEREKKSNIVPKSTKHQESDDEYLEEMDVDFQLEKEKPSQLTADISPDTPQPPQRHKSPDLPAVKEETKTKEKEKKHKDKKEKKQKKKKRHHKNSKKKSRADSSEDDDSSSEDEVEKPKKSKNNKDKDAEKVVIQKLEEPKEEKRKHHAKKKKGKHGRGSDNSENSSEDESDDSSKRRPKRKRSKLASSKDGKQERDGDNGEVKEKVEIVPSKRDRNDRSKSRSPERKHKKAKDKKSKKKKHEKEGKSKHKKKHSKKSRANSTSTSRSSESEKDSSTESSSSSSSSEDESDSDKKRKHSKKKKDSDGGKDGKRKDKDDKNKKDKGGDGSSRRGSDATGGGSSHGRDYDRKDRSRHERDKHDRDKDRHRRHSGGRKRTTFEELMAELELANNDCMTDVGSNGADELSAILKETYEDQDPEKLVASLLQNIEVPPPVLANHSEVFATSALLSELDDDEVLKSVLQKEDINITDILLKNSLVATSPAVSVSRKSDEVKVGEENSKRSGTMKENIKQTGSSWSDDSQDGDEFTKVAGLAPSSGYGTEKSAGTDTEQNLTDLLSQKKSSSSGSGSSSSGSSSSSSSSGSSSDGSGSSSESEDSETEKADEAKIPVETKDSAAPETVTKPVKLYDPFVESSESDLEELRKSGATKDGSRLPKEKGASDVSNKTKVSTEDNTLDKHLLDGPNLTPMEALPIPTVLSTATMIYPLKDHSELGLLETEKLKTEPPPSDNIVNMVSVTGEQCKKSERRRSTSRSISGSSRSRSPSYSPRDRYYEGRGRRHPRSGSYERGREDDVRRRRSPSPRSRPYGPRPRHHREELRHHRDREREYDRHRRRRSRSRSRSRSCSRSRSPSPRGAAARYHHRNSRWRDDFRDGGRRYGGRPREDRPRREFMEHPEFLSPREDYRGRRRKEFEEMLHKEGYFSGSGGNHTMPPPTTDETESPPLQLNVADSTISDSELAATGGMVPGSSQLMPGATPADIFGGISKEALYEHNQHLHASGHSMYFYPPHPLQPEESNTVVMGHEFTNQPQYPPSTGTDGYEYNSSPKRLSLDERLEKEMGIQLREEIPTSNHPSQSKQTTMTSFFSKGVTPASEGKLSASWTQPVQQKQSQVLQLGNVIQVVPGQLANDVTVTAADVSCSRNGPKSDVAAADVQKVESEEIPSNRRVVTIKVPVVPFKVPVLSIAELAAMSAPPVPRKSKKLKRKKKSSSGSSSKRIIKVSEDVDVDGEQEKVESEDNDSKLGQLEQEKSISKEDPTDNDSTEIKVEVPDCLDTQKRDEHEDMKEADESEPGETKKDTEEDNKPEEMEVAVEVKRSPEDPEIRRQRLLKLPARGILVSAGWRERTEDRVKLKARGVTFKDGINPGNGTSSSGGEEMASPPPPSTESVQAPTKVKVKRKKKVKVKLPKVKDESKENCAAEGDLPPPPIPSVPYPYCPPGILYQVNLPYAMVYAQAVAEKGFDIVFQASSQIPTIGNQKCEAVDVPVTPELESQPQEIKPQPSKPVEHKPFHHHASQKPIPPYVSQTNKERSHRIPSFNSEHHIEKPKPISPVEGCRIPTIVRSAPSTSVQPDISYNDFLDHPMSYDMPMEEMHDTPPPPSQCLQQLKEHTDNNKIIPIIGHGTSPSTTIRHKSKNIHHHIPVVNKSNIVEVPTIDYLEPPVVASARSNDSNTDANAVPELM